MHEPSHPAPPSLLFPLLRLLAHGRSVTPETLQARLDAPADRVAHALEAARAHGADWQQGPEGIRLARPLDLLDAAAVAEAMDPGWRRAFDLVVVDATGSTNTDLREAAPAPPSGRALAAELQFAGRGRRGRHWKAAIGGSLTVSVLWKFARGVAGLSGLSLAVGLAVARALEACGARGVALKWPNDVLAVTPAGPAKLAGILIEIASGADGAAHAVIGIGINVRLGEAARQVDQAVTDLAGLDVAASRNIVLARLLEALGQVCRDFEREGFAPLAEEWNARHAFRGERVAITRDGDAPLEGIARGVDVDGALLLETGDTTLRLVSGEVSLRLA